MHTLRLCSVLTAILGSSAVAQDVQFERYALDNGMQVILHEDHSLPKACVNLWYHVGSKDEVAGRSGFAHLFEHLMFMGTNRVPGSGFDDQMEAGGGTNNATTSRDRTSYFSWGPPSLLPTLLWLEADRMEEFGKAMTQEKLDKQREVVRNERRETVEMRPYGKSEERLGSMLYPPEHPYHTSVIGSHKDLEAASLQDVKDFFATYYVPNNATLVVAGDFDSNEVKPLIDKWFGTIPRGAEVPRKKVPPVELGELRRATMTDRVQFPRLSMIWLSPPFFKPGDAEMDLIASILTDGKTSRLYKRLVYQDKLATSVTAYQWSSLHASQFHIEATARPGVSLDRIEKIIDEELDRLRDDGPTDAELARIQSSLEFDAVQRLQSLLSRANALNRYNYFLGSPGGFRADLERYRKAKVADVQTWARRVLAKDARLIVRVLPEEKATQNPRDERPAPGVARPFVPSPPVKLRLSNGIEVRHWQRKQLPLVRVVLLLRGGAATDPRGKGGRASMMAGMLDEGAGERSALEFSDALQQLGASFGVIPDRHSVQVSLQSLAGKFDAALELFADAVQRPRFEPKEWERVKSLHLRGLEQQRDSPEQLARQLSTRAFFGPDHPYGRPISGMVDSIRALELADIKSAHASLCRPERATFFIAGDLTAARAKRALERAFGAWKQPALPLAAPEIPPAPRNGLRVFVVDKPGTVQTVVRFLLPGPRLGHPKRVTFQAINTVLGGSFTSRLNANLREKRGYTYNAGSGFAMWPTTGILLAAATVQSKSTGPSIREFLKELRGMASGNITATEVRKARLSNRQGLVDSLESLSGLLSVATRLEESGLPFADLENQLAELDRLDSRRMNEAVGEAIAIEHACLLLVGDKKLILEQLRGLGLPTAIELDVRGLPAPGR